jgi:hypothetical protein
MQVVCQRSIAPSCPTNRRSCGTRAAVSKYVVHHRCHGGLVFVHDRTELRHGAAIGDLLIRELVFACGLRTQIDARQVVMMLNDLKRNLVERSGGSYDAPAMQGEARDGRTVAREGCFVGFARGIRKRPLRVESPVHLGDSAFSKRRHVQMMRIAHHIGNAP